MGAFSTRPYENTSHLSHAFKQHKSSARHKRLEKKLTDNSVSVYEEMVLGVEKINLPQKNTNLLYMQKCIHSTNYMIKKPLTLTDNYGDLINFIAQKLEEPITKNYLETCPKNATYLSNTAESMVDAMNFYFDSKSPAETNESNFITLYTDEAENSSYKKYFAMFVICYSNKTQKVVTSFLGISNLKGKTAAKIMDVIKNFFWQNL